MPESAEVPAGEEAHFGHLLARVQKGSEGAARQLIDSFGPHILRVVRRRLNRRLRPRFDSIDFVQAVWTSFFARREDLGQFTRPEQVIAYLASAAANKVIDETRTHLAPKRRLRSREIESLEPQTPRHQAALAARQPTPSEAVAGNELWHRLLEGQSSMSRRILNLRRQGLTSPEIAERLDITQRTVNRVIEQIIHERFPWATQQ
jgi:RNA polymerase sigma-70 factor (ECF subfamily)